MAKNLEEYVVEKVLEFMRYRDEEIREMARCLEDFDIIKCPFCDRYGRYHLECEFCERVSCTTCVEVENQRSWNLSGCNICHECEKKYCTGCRNLLTECLGNPICGK